MNEFKELKSRLQDAEYEDKEIGHIEGDNILCDIALSITLTLEERTELVQLYNKLPKWYA